MTTTVTAMSGLTPYDLRVEHLSCPMGLDVKAPRFEWKLRSNRADDAQTGFRLVISRDDLEGPSEWDSGWRKSAMKHDVEYEGPSLQASTRYRWHLDVRGADGHVGSAGAWFETGLDLTRHPVGLWIGAGDAPADDPQRSADEADAAPVCCLRRSFTLPAGRVSRARLHATARGMYRAHLNGARIGDEELSPGWTDYRERISYQTFDVTSMMSEGENVIGLELGPGWWSGRAGFDPELRRGHYGTQPWAWALLEIVLEDGRSIAITTDGQWVWGPGARVYADLFAGEMIDARRASGWCEQGADVSGWMPVATDGADTSRLVGLVDEPVRVIDEVTAIATIEVRPGTWIYDFGQNLVGRVRADLPPLPPGTAVRIRHGEILSEGELYIDNLRGVEATDVFVSAGSAGRFEPAFTTHGFRYAEISGLPEPLPLEAVCAVVLSSDLPRAGRLHTSDADVNRLLDNIRWGQDGNYVGLPTDCPQRDERLGWMADAQVFLPTASYNRDVAAFFTRWLRDVRSAQSAEGSFADVAPILANFDHDGAPAWADAGVIIPWHLYRTYGDRRLLEESLPSMTRWVDFVERTNPDLIWTRRTGKAYGDWLQIGADTPDSVLATAYFARSTQIVADALKALGRNTDASRYYTLASRIRAAFRAAFVDERLTIEGDTQTGYLLALAFDLIGSEDREAVTAHLVRALERNDGLLTTGFVGVSLLCPVLSSVGRDDLAFGLLQETRYPSWLYSVRHGATTIWERWDGWTEHGGFQSSTMNSFNHYALGSIGEWLYRDVAGIDQLPDSVAFEHILIAPRAGGTLTEVSGSYESARGLISTRWTVSDQVFTLQLELPPGAPTTVRVPTGDQRFRHNDRVVDPLGRGEGYGEFLVGSGIHEFTTTAPARMTGSSRP